jgi:uncharacterized protein GlcG (DUF336 family)
MLTHAPRIASPDAGVVATAAAPRRVRRYGLRLQAGVLALAALAVSPAAWAQSATHSIRVLTPEAALKATQAALQSCRASGFQVAIAVVDRFGTAQAMVRDRFAGPHTPDTAINKAWTAVSFRTGTTELAAATQAGQPSSGIRHLPRFVGVGGGVLIEAGGSLIGAIGVSGAPNGAADDACAKAGIAAIKDELEL